MHPCELLEQHLPSIRRAIASACRRRGVFDGDADDVEQEVMVKLADDDCAALGRLREESTVTTFVSVTATRVILDEIRRVKSRWRPSAAACRLGDTAMALEALLHRDGWTYDEAVEKLHAQGARESIAELDEIRAQLHDRPARRFVSEEALVERSNPGGASDPEADCERQTVKERLTGLLPRLMAELGAEDRFLLKRLYLSGRSVAQVAIELCTDQRALYRRRDRALALLRKRLEAEGLDWEEVRTLTGWPDLELDVDAGGEPEKE